MCTSVDRMRSAQTRARQVVTRDKWNDVLDRTTLFRGRGGLALGQTPLTATLPFSKRHFDFARTYGPAKARSLSNRTYETVTQCATRSQHALIGGSVGVAGACLVLNTRTGKRKRRERSVTGSQEVNSRAGMTNNPRE